MGGANKGGGGGGRDWRVGNKSHARNAVKCKQTKTRTLTKTYQLLALKVITLRVPEVNSHSF